MRKITEKNVRKEDVDVIPSKIALAK